MDDDSIEHDLPQANPGWVRSENVDPLWKAAYSDLEAPPGTAGWMNDRNEPIRMSGSEARLTDDEGSNVLNEVRPSGSSTRLAEPVVADHRTDRIGAGIERGAAREGDNSNHAANREEEERRMRYERRLHDEVAEAERKHGRDSVSAEMALGRLCAYLRGNNRSGEAIPYMERRLDILTRRGDNYVSRAAMCDYIAGAHREAGHPEYVQRHWRQRAEAIRRRR